MAALSGLPSDARTLTSQQTGRIAALLEPLDEQSIMTDLKDAGLSSLSPSALGILAAASRIADDQGVQNLRNLKTLLRDFDAQSVLACETGEGSIFQEIQQERIGGVFKNGDVSWQDVERLANENGMFRLGILLSGVMLFAGGLFGIDAAYRWGMALIYNRKACRIATILEVGARAVEGHIITLGRGGCRFQPHEMTYFDEILVYLRGEMVFMNIEGTELEVSVSAIYEDVADFRFEDHISIKQQREFLEYSTISPFYVKKARGQKTTSPEEIA